MHRKKKLCSINFSQNYADTPFTCMDVESRIMIYIFTDKNSLLIKLHEEFQQKNIDSELIQEAHLKRLEHVYARKDLSGHAIIADADLKSLQDNMWIDILEGLAKRLPVLVLSSGDSETVARLNLTSSLSWMESPKKEAVINYLRSCGLLGSNNTSLYKKSIPVYSPLIAARLLESNGFLSILSIHAADFSKVALEYGSAVYHQLQMALQKILYEMWGGSGSFRKSDILCRRAMTSNTFYILLERSRSENFMPVPGDLERLAERLSLRLENLMWQELMSASQERILPKFLELVPRFIVGYASTLHNPCIDSFSTVDDLLRSCRDTAKIEDSRMLNRQRELIQTLIQAPDLLNMHFQGVFDLRKIPVSKIKTFNSELSIEQIEDSIYAFEALVRVNKPNLQKLVGVDMSVNLDYLNPGVLFARAEEVNLKLELDQACFGRAMKTFKSLPGKLMVNILPRNFYFLEGLQHSIPEGVEVLFEVSETEAINNMSLIQHIRDKISESSHGIAIDDFGKGYAGVDRIIKIQPALIKLDQILINQIDKDVRMQSFIKGLVEAARSTNSLVLAEGIETKEELLTLAKIGIDLVQGFYLHRPESRENLLKKIGKPKKGSGKKTKDVA